MSYSSIHRETSPSGRISAYTFRTDSTYLGTPSPFGFYLLPRKTPPCFPFSFLFIVTKIPDSVNIQTTFNLPLLYYSHRDALTLNPPRLILPQHAAYYGVFLSPTLSISGDHCRTAKAFLYLAHHFRDILKFKPHALGILVCLILKHHKTHDQDNHSFAITLRNNALTLYDTSFDLDRSFSFKTYNTAESLSPAIQSLIKTYCGTEFYLYKLLFSTLSKPTHTQTRLLHDDGSPKTPSFLSPFFNPLP